MYFKVEKTSSLGQILQAFERRRIATFKTMKDVALELSDLPDPAFFTKPGYVSGKMYAIEFSTHPGKEWAEFKRHHEYGRRFFYPSAIVKKGHPILEKFRSGDDPISEEEFCAYFGLKPGTIGTFTWYRSPGLQSSGPFYFVEIQDQWAMHYMPLPSDMVEILASDYQRLLKGKKETAAQ